MATERILESLSNRLMDLDHKIMVTAEETYKFVESKKNTCTVKKTKSDINRFRTWLADDGETRDIEDIVPQELDMYLSRFFLSPKNKKTKQELEPGTLRGINSSIRRYLVEKNYIVDPVNAKEFKHSRDTLKAKSVDLKEKGLGNKSSRADPFTGDEIKELYEKKLLGKETPYSLVSTLWMNNTQHLGLRGRQEHITMLWGDLELKKTITGRRYLEFSERATKTRKSITDDARLFKTKVFEQKDDPNCPVEMYLLYRSKRPNLDPDSRFYLTPNRYWDSKPEVLWFKPTPMGKDSIGSIAKTLNEKAGFTARHTNHSGRKTFITTLLDKGVPPTEVAQISGHKNLASLNHYHTLSLARQEELSDIIHMPTKSATTSSMELNSDTVMSDNELLAASQEIERTLNTIQSYEELPTNNMPEAELIQKIDLPVTHSPGGTLSLNNFHSHPQTLFSGCTFNSGVTIVLKQ